MTKCTERVKEMAITMGMLEVECGGEVEQIGSWMSAGYKGRNYSLGNYPVFIFQCKSCRKVSLQ